MNIYQHIDRSRVQFDFVQHTQDECAFEKQAKEMGARIFSVPRFNGINYFDYTKAWKSFFISNPDMEIVHGHMTSTASIYLSIAKSYGLATISHVHSGGLRGSYTERVFKFLLLKKLPHIPNFTFACSKSAGEFVYGEEHIKEDNFFLFRNAIKSEKFAFSASVRKIKREELGIEGKFVLGHVGRFDEPKNQSFLLHIFKAVSERENNVALLLVGDGPLRPSIEKKVSDLGLSDKVFFTGVRSDVPELLQAMDVFVFPSIFEGLPVTLIEAQASGLACLVSSNITREVSITDLVEFFSLEKTVEEWASRILELKENCNRRNTSEEIRRAGYDVKETAKWLEDFYLDLAEVR